MGDPLLFKRALANLISNAVKYTPLHGKVSIRIAEKTDGSAVVVVHDTGSGIAPENLPRIFDRFFRADQSRSQDPGGTGLGLSIVKSIMDIHGGTVSAMSDFGRATTLTLTFPPS